MSEETRLSSAATEYPLPEDIAEQIRKAIKEAQEMLEFAVADGLAVSDDVIEKIEQALGLLDPNRPLTSKDRAEFQKAYRDLAHALSPLTIEEVRYETNFNGARWKRHSRNLAVVCLVLAYPSFLVGQVVCRQWNAIRRCTACAEWDAGFGLAVCGILAGFLLWRGVELFTGLATNRKLNRMIRCCYAFTFFALLLSLLPFASLAVFPAVPRLLTLGPVNILQGCADAWSADGEQTQEVPKEIRCGEVDQEGRQAHQWLINIGGKVGTSVLLTDDSSDAQTCKTRNEEYRYDHWHVQGGLVIPLYVVVLALMGSAVSMTRRVPEYQRDAFGLHETLSNAKARENLVFQIMQVFSAPLVVTAAYYLFKPDSRTTTVLLGFASGFASEPILLAIRGLADKLKPASSEDAIISVFVTPSSVTLSPGRSQLFDATVRGSANGTVTWSIDPSNSGVLSQSGLYTAPGTVPKEQAITILATSVADPSKIGKAVVNLIPKEEAA
ncbi:MAG: hypothetical protein HYZ50_17965 [Deltaproteobacteria bacterium]|nr:hypothetical protein [Deltaproteobacteria bacterium]